MNATAGAVRAGKTSLKGDLFLNVGSQVLLRVVTAVSALYVARVLGPAQFGTWAVLQVLFMYTAQAHFGTVNGMLREIPIALAQARSDTATSFTQTTWTFVTLSSVVTAILSGVGVYWIFKAQPFSVLIAVGSAWLILVQLQSVFFQFYCRAFTRFKLLAFCSTTQSIITIPLCIWFVSRWGIAGYLFSLSIGFTLIAAAVVFACGVRFRFSTHDLSRLLAIGIPMLPGTLMLYLNMSMERIVLASTVETFAVGTFAAGAFFFQTGGTVWELIVYTWYPRLAELHGQSGSLGPLLGAFRKVIPGILWLSSLLQGFAYIILPVVLRRLLPEYVQSIVVAQLLILSVNVWGIAQLLSFSMSIIGRQKRSAALQGGFLAAKLGFLLVAVLLFRSLWAVAVGSVAALLLYALATFVAWKRLSCTDFISIAHCFALWAVPGALAVACTFVSGPHHWGIAGLIYLIAIGVISLVIDRRSQAFRQFYAWDTAR